MVCTYLKTSDFLKLGLSIRYDNNAVCVPLIACSVARHAVLPGRAVPAVHLALSVFNHSFPCGVVATDGSAAVDGAHVTTSRTQVHCHHGCVSRRRLSWYVITNVVV